MLIIRRVQTECIGVCFRKEAIVDDRSLEVRTAACADGTSARDQPFAAASSSKLEMASSVSFSGSFSRQIAYATASRNNASA